MKAKDYLLQLHNLKRKQKRVDEEIQTLDAAITSAGAIRYDKLNVQITPDNRMEADIIRLGELRQKLIELKIEYYDLYVVISHQINGLDAIGLYKDILFMRYLEGDEKDRGKLKSFWKIAQELHYDTKYITNCHGRALQIFFTQYLKDVD